MQSHQHNKVINTGLKFLQLTGKSEIYLSTDSKLTAGDVVRSMVKYATLSAQFPEDSNCPPHDNPQDDIIVAFAAEYCPHVHTHQAPMVSAVQYLVQVGGKVEVELSHKVHLYFPCIPVNETLRRGAIRRPLFELDRTWRKDHCHRSSAGTI